MPSWRGNRAMRSDREAACRRNTDARLLGFGLVPREIFKDRDQEIMQNLPIFGRDPGQRNLVGVHGQRLKNGLKVPALPREVDMLFAPIAIFGAPLNNVGLFELGQRAVNRGLGEAGHLAQFLLGQPFLLPQDAQENPLSKGNAMLRQPSRQRTVEPARAKPDKMRDPLLRILRRRQLRRKVLTPVIFQSSADSITSLAKNTEPRRSWKALLLRIIWRALTQAAGPTQKEASR